MVGAEARARKSNRGGRRLGVFRVREVSRGTLIGIDSNKAPQSAASRQRVRCEQHHMGCHGDDCVSAAYFKSLARLEKHQESVQSIIVLRQCPTDRIFAPRSTPKVALSDLPGTLGDLRWSNPVM